LKDSPWLFAYDKSGVLYRVRMFPSADGLEKSLVNQEPQILNKRPKNMALNFYKNKILAVMSFPDEQAIGVMSIDYQTGLIDRPIKTMKLGVKPSQVGFIADMAVISDEGENSIHVFKINQIFSFLTENQEAKPINISVGWESGRIFLADKDLENGIKPYALVFEALGRKGALIDLKAGKVISNFTTKDFITAAYFPDLNSRSFAENKNWKNWLALVDDKGQLEHYEITKENGSFVLKKISSVDLLSDENLDLNSLLVLKILGGTIKPDGQKKDEKTCQDNREVFFIASGNSRAYLGTDSLEVEAHGHACENEKSVSRLGTDSANRFSANRFDELKKRPETDRSPVR